MFCVLCVIFEVAEPVEEEDLFLNSRELHRLIEVVLPVPATRPSSRMVEEVMGPSVAGQDLYMTHPHIAIREVKDSCLVFFFVGLVDLQGFGQRHDRPLTALAIYQVHLDIGVPDDLVEIPEVPVHALG